MAESEPMGTPVEPRPTHLTVAVRRLCVTFRVYEQPVLSARDIAARGFPVPRLGVGRGNP